MTHVLTGRGQGWSMLAASLAAYPEFGTVFELVLFGVAFVGGISAAVPFVPVVSLVVSEACSVYGKLPHLNCLSLTTHKLGDKRSRLKKGFILSLQLFNFNSLDDDKLSLTQYLYPLLNLSLNIISLKTIRPV